MTSRYFRISRALLLEYIYDEKPIPISEVNFKKIYNSVTNAWSLIPNITDAHPRFLEIQNWLDQSVQLEDRFQNLWYLLDQDNPLGPWNTVSPNLEVTNLYNTPPIIDYQIKWDLIRVHIASGYNFTDYEGIILELQSKLTNGQSINLSSLSFTSSDEWSTLNPTPFLLNDVLWGKYIEFRVPSIRSLLEDQNYNYPSDANYPTRNIVPGQSLVTNAGEFKCHFIWKSQTDTSDYTSFFVRDVISFAIPKEDEYEKLSASIEKSTNGDFFELSAKWDGLNIENYISRLGPEWGIIHQIEVIENLGSIQAQPTQPYIITQVDRFENPIFFRPILFYSNRALNWVMIYTIKLFNRTTNETILKTSQRIFNDHKKWGKNLTKISLNGTPQFDVIYNKVENLQHVGRSVNKLNASTIKYIPIFLERNGIVITQTNNILEGDNIIIENNSFYKEQGELILTLYPTDNFYSFRFFNKINSNYNPIDIGSWKGLNLIFGSGDDKIQIPSIAIPGIAPGRGEAVFRIDDSLYKKISLLNTNDFYICNSNETGDSTVIYSGTWTEASSFNQLNSDNLIKKYQFTISKLKNENLEIESKINNSQLKLSQINSQLITLENQKKQLEEKVSQLRTQVDIEIQNLKKYIDTKNIKLPNTVITQTRINQILGNDS
jgi:hypothetical protein